MITSDLLGQAWAKAEGEEFTDGVGSDNWNYMFTLANYYITSCQNEYGVDWVSLYDPLFDIGTVTATDTFDLDPSDVRKLSNETEDYVRIVHTDGTSYTDYTIVPANQIKRYQFRNGMAQKVCAKVGASLKFARPFQSSDIQFGGTIYVPKYGSFDALVNENSTVPIDNPLWLVCMIAYDVALHDILRKDISGNILAEAAEIMKAMKSDNNDAQDIKLNTVDLGFIGSQNVGYGGGNTANPLDM